MARRKNKTQRKRAKSSPLSVSSPSPSPSPPSPTAALALCALVVAAFFPALTAGFVWDDVIFTDAKPVRDLSGLWQIWFAPRALADTREAHYWPLLYSTFWLEHKLWGFNPLGYHIVNLILHSAVTLLLWRLLSRLKIPGAWLAAAVFAVHPVHTESVAWVIGRKDILAALFFLSAAWFYFNFVERRRRRDYTVAVALFVAGMLSKSTVVTLPAALLLWHWWKTGRVAAADIKRTAPFFVIGVAITVADWLYYTSIESVALGYTLIERAQIAASALWFYTGKLFWPSPLMVIYPHFTVGVGEVVAWLALIAAVTVAVVLWFARHRIGRGAFAGVAFFTLTLSPVLGIIDYGFMQFSFVADRYQYLAAAGVMVPLAAAVAVGIARLRAANFIATTLLLLPLMFVSWQQAGIYKNRDTFYGHIIAHNPHARNIHYNLGKGHHLAGRLDDALAAFGAARAQRPEWFWPHVGMGTTAADLGRFDEAEAHFADALKVAPSSPEVLNHLAVFRIKQRHFDDALMLFEKLIALQPGNARFHSGRGAALFHLRRHDEALRSFDRALALEPSFAEARSNRESLLRLMNDGEDK